MTVAYAARAGTGAWYCCTRGVFFSSPVEHSSICTDLVQTAIALLLCGAFVWVLLRGPSRCREVPCLADMAHTTLERAKPRPRRGCRPALLVIVFSSVVFYLSMWTAVFEMGYE